MPTYNGQTVNHYEIGRLTDGRRNVDMRRMVNKWCRKFSENIAENWVWGAGPWAKYEKQKQTDIIQRMYQHCRDNARAEHDSPSEIVREFNSHMVIAKRSGPRVVIAHDKPSPAPTPLDAGIGASSSGEPSLYPADDGWAPVAAHEHAYCDDVGEGVEVVEQLEVLFQETHVELAPQASQTTHEPMHKKAKTDSDRQPSSGGPSHESMPIIAPLSDGAPQPLEDRAPMVPMPANFESTVAEVQHLQEQRQQCDPPAPTAAMQNALSGKRTKGDQMNLTPPNIKNAKGNTIITLNEDTNKHTHTH